MASGIKSAFLRSAAIKHNLGITAFSMPAGCYLALYTADPTVNDTGTEVSGGSYARQNLGPNWGAESGGLVANANAITFPAMPATTVTHWAIRSAATGGNLLYFGKFDISIVKNSGESFVLNAGDIKISER